MKPKTQLRFASLCSVAMVMVLGNSMLIPVLPLLKRNLGYTAVQAGLLITAFSAAAGLTIPLAGFLSDRFGRKNVIVPALILYGAAGVASGLALRFFGRSLWPVLVARAIQGAGAGGTYQIAMALTGDIFQTKERRAALGYLEASNGGGKVIAPLAGSALGMLHWSAPFYLYGIASLPVAYLVWTSVREPQGNRQQKSAGEYRDTLVEIIRTKAGSLAACFLAGMLVLFLYFGVLANLSDILEAERGLSGILLGLVIAIPVSAMAATSFLSGRWLARCDAVTVRKAASIGLSLAAAGLLAATFVRSHPLLVASIAAMGVGNGIVLPSLNSLITSCANIEQRGLITSLYGTARHIGAASGPPLFVMLIQKVGPLAYGLAAAAAISTSLLVLLTVREKLMLEDEKGTKQEKTGEAQRPAPVTYDP
ncbi:MAG: MFS transporter [Bacillota bacterium]|nr:MFS transporter [Bacillota bacterium]